MSNEAIGNPNEWDTKLLRFTGFLLPGTEIQDTEWWNSVVREPPDNRQIQEKRRLSQNIGRFEEGNLTLKSESFRIDWLYQAVDNPEELDMRGVLGPFNDALQVFQEAVYKWFSSGNFPSLQRVAFGAILLQPVETREIGYARLSKYLKSVNIDPKGSRDFLYRINRRRDSSTNIADLRVNRLATWSVNTERLVEFDFHHEEKYSGQETFACNLEVDISTVPDPKRKFNASECRNIFDELAQLGIEISQQGDIK